VISGTGEAGATLIIYDNNKAVGKVTVGADSKWSFSFDYDLSLGAHSITSVQTDKAGNTSLMSDARSFTVVEVGVKAALADEYSVMDQNSADSHASLACNSLASNIVNAELNPDSNANRDFLLQSMPPNTETNRVDLTSENIAKLLQTVAETDGSIQTHLDTDHKTSVNDLFLDASVLEPKEQQIEDVIESAMKHSATTSENIMNSTSETVDQYMNNLPSTTIFSTDAIAELLNSQQVLF
jgi:DNA-binding protein YbaB